MHVHNFSPFSSLAWAALPFAHCKCTKHLMNYHLACDVIWGEAVLLYLETEFNITES
jgi:hypothetical protein